MGIDTKSMEMIAVAKYHMKPGPKGLFKSKRNAGAYMHVLY